MKDKRVAELRLQGSLTEGARVTLQWWWEESFPHIEGALGGGALRPSDCVIESYAIWQRCYRGLGEAVRLEFDPDSEPVSPQRREELKQECDRAAADLEKCLNSWLQGLPRASEVIHRLGQLKGESSGSVRFLIRTDDPLLQRLPWHLWEHSTRQIAIAPLNFEEKPMDKLRSPVRILTILGDDLGIDLEVDRKLIKDLPNCDEDSQILLQPNRQQVAHFLTDERGWDILFFSGHSETEGERGRIYLNANDSFTLDELRGHLQVAANNGLKACILNCCDGLGLSLQLADFGIPYCICMREPVPDAVAHKFLKFFLDSFSKEDSLHAAFLAAQTHLESIQNLFPQATWLPVLFQQPNARPLVWPQPHPKPEPIIMPNSWKFLKYVLLGTIAVVASIAISFWGPPPEPIRNHIHGDSISAGEEILGYPTNLKHGAAESLYRKHWQEGIEGFSDAWVLGGRDPETLIYLNNALVNKALSLSPGSQSRIIAVTVPFLRDLDTGEPLGNRTLAYRLLQGVAQAQTEANRKLWDRYLGEDESQINVSFLPRNEIGENISLKIVIADDFNHSEEAVKRAKALAQNPEILGVVGHYTSDMSKPSIPIYREQQLPLVSPGSTAKELVDLGGGYFFRTVPTTETEANSIANYLLNTIGKKTVAVFYSSISPYPTSLWGDFKRFYEGAGGKVFELDKRTDPSVDLASPSFNPTKTLRAIERGESEPEAIVLVPDGEVTAAQANAFKLVKENAGRYPIVGSWGLDNDELFGDMANAPEQSLAISVPWHQLMSKNRDFPKHAEQLWGGPVYAQTALAYDATRSFVRALQLLPEEPTRQSIRNALAAPDFAVDGATGTVQFEENGDRRDPPQVIIQALQCSTSGDRTPQIQLFPLGFSCQPEGVEWPGL